MTTVTALNGVLVKHVLRNHIRRSRKIPRITADKTRLYAFAVRSLLRANHFPRLQRDRDDHACTDVGTTPIARFGEKLGTNLKIGILHLRFPIVDIAADAVNRGDTGMNWQSVVGKNGYYLKRLARGGSLPTPLHVSEDPSSASASSPVLRKERSQARCLIQGSR